MKSYVLCNIFFLLASFNLALADDFEVDLKNLPPNSKISVRFNAILSAGDTDLFISEIPDSRNPTNYTMQRTYTDIYYKCFFVATKAMPYNRTVTGELAGFVKSVDFNIKYDDLDEDSESSGNYKKYTYKYKNLKATYVIELQNVSLNKEPIEAFKKLECRSYSHNNYDETSPYLNISTYITKYKGDNALKASRLIETDRDSFLREFLSLKIGTFSSYLYGFGSITQTTRGIE